MGKLSEIYWRKAIRKPRDETVHWREVNGGRETIITDHGQMFKARKNIDVIVRDAEGYLYPINKNLFKKLYQEIK